MSSYLSELCRFYDRLSADPESGMPPEGMSAEQISFALVISEDGKLVSVQDLRDGKGRAARFFVPAAVKRSVNVASNFLWDNTGYALGVDGKGKPKRTLQTAESFKMLHRQLLASCDDVHAKALLAFLEVWRPVMFEELDEKEALLDCY
ncbi:MAG: type I-C CRISPR-associated protein Cas8c/Csd1, partial [Desulfovibrionaceae bacterium]|nr:type I-C CRISPR-associated protein Cas8c/Csd1 [Desulfovibrionaceae bacterium]